MIRSRKILVLPGDGIDPEVVEQVQKIIAWMNHELSAGFEKSHRATR
jgi:isocitrate/isopropylmalate dehydrogenase